MVALARCRTCDEEYNLQELLNAKDILPEELSEHIPCPNCGTIIKVYYASGDNLYKVRQSNW
jgi:predicted RNA-binding Zn-ribbon protein involved in translation (DUF1610 family)